ncbi:hypothetical protein ACO0RG_003152 [Hanseniaspora osmophila]
MSAVWRKAGFTYNTYASVAASTLRNALKQEFKTAHVLERSQTDVKVLKFTNGVQADPVPLKKD